MAENKASSLHTAIQPPERVCGWEHQLLDPDGRAEYQPQGLLCLISLSFSFLFYKTDNNSNHRYKVRIEGDGACGKMMSAILHTYGLKRLTFLVINFHRLTLNTGIHSKIRSKSTFSKAHLFEEINFLFATRSKFTGKIKDTIYARIPVCYLLVTGHCKGLWNNASFRHKLGFLLCKSACLTYTHLSLLISGTNNYPSKCNWNYPTSRRNL